MLDDLESRLEPLERRSATLLLAAGGLWVVDVVLQALRAFTTTTVPNVAVVLTVIPALLLTMLAVVGFYPDLADERPRIAGAAVLLAVLALAAFAVNLVWLLAAIGLDAPNPHIGVLAASVLVMALAMVLFAGGSVLVSVPSRTVGLLLVGLLAVWVGWFADFAVGVVPGNGDVVFHVLFAALTLAAGYAHRTGVAPLESGGSSQESAA